VDSPYEEPEAAEVVIDTDGMDQAGAVQTVTELVWKANHGE